VGLQYALGVATLLLAVPPGLAAAHQAEAVLVLTAAVATLHAARGGAATARLIKDPVPVAVQESP
jgi:cytochrome c oxidase assembly protein subunit 15